MQSTTSSESHYSGDFMNHTYYSSSQAASDCGAEDEGPSIAFSQTSASSTA